MSSDGHGDYLEPPPPLGSTPRPLSTAGARLSRYLRLARRTRRRNREGVPYGLDATDRGMEAAGRRMGALARMAEGKGWWGRMMLFAVVYGMMAGLVLMFLFLPKLRF